MKPKDLPVYRQKEKILEALKTHQVIVVESPTGSGKTTQLPVILDEAGFAERGTIGVTQPRRIATLSVSDYIARQLDSQVPGIIGYKMRFEDKTIPETKIKIMTDGTLLQEIKSDTMLSRYSAIIVDEAHERSLNIDFILGLIKQILEKRPEFKVIISSATINVDVFSEYFFKCPVVRVETSIYPVAIIYDPPDPAAGYEGLIRKITDLVARAVSEKRKGDILIFLSGEGSIKDCVTSLLSAPYRKNLMLLPLYARLNKDEQERIFIPTPRGKIKVVVATNIAETSVTIDGVTSVIDSGLSKINYYNPKNYTSSLIEGPISRASCNQRKGRAGRTQPGICYRLYSKQDYSSRPLFTMEEIYRTDLSEVVLRMAELGIRDFESFDFISSPGKQGIAGAVETLRLFEAIDRERELTAIGRLMVQYPVIPRLSRIIVEAIMQYPDVVEEALIATTFLSTLSPFLLPQGDEIAARKAHHNFRNSYGDFVSYLNLFRAYSREADKEKFCEKNYLDHKTMSEITNVKEQLEEITGSLGIPILSGGPVKNYLCSIAKGLLQFVCTRSGRNTYKSLTADRIEIHPGSVMFKERPDFIVAGEVMRTTRMYARSVSPLEKDWLPQISRDILSTFGSVSAPRDKPSRQAKEPSAHILIGTEMFNLANYKGKKKIAVLPWEKISAVVKNGNLSISRTYKGVRGTVVYGDYELMSGEKIITILKVLPWIDIGNMFDKEQVKPSTFKCPEDLHKLVEKTDIILKLCRIKKKKQLGFMGLYTDGSGNFWFKCARGYHTALSQSLASLDILADLIDTVESPALFAKVNALYRKLSQFFEQGN
ncbi:MAG: ATP-dependent RNA helicase [Spirochaetales bacterium]|nr:MAG: ATP-dependent RNA helicase [Spirochaetales bacterium]